MSSAASRLPSHGRTVRAERVQSPPLGRWDALVRARSAGRGRRFLVFALAALVSACAGARRNAPLRSCEPADAPGGLKGSARQLAGAYQLRLVATMGPATGAQVDGVLRLHSFAEGERSGADTPMRQTLVGSARLALDRVGAVAPGTIESEDPARPGVLVLEEQTPAGARVLLRLGSEANRQDLQPFESRYVVLELRAADQTGFRGRWRSGLMETEAEGYFCAWREEGP